MTFSGSKVRLHDEIFYKIEIIATIDFGKLLQFRKKEGRV